MQFLESLSIQHFKGIESCEVRFTDLTILSGLNNSGKTSILQAIQLVMDSIPRIHANQHLLNVPPESRVLDLKSLAATLGIPDASWLVRKNQAPDSFGIHAKFSNGLELDITALTENSFTFNLPQYTKKTVEEAKAKLTEIASWGAELVLPPGIVASREDMIAGPALANMIRQGKGAQLWRNSLFWSIQNGGIEKFAKVKDLVEKYFPDVRVEIPVLDSQTSPPGILMKFKDRSGAKLDISQSGSGLRTFLTLARLLEQSDASIFLLDEPDAHLHASQQSTVLRQLIEATEANDKQIVITTHSPEILTQAPEECIRWIESSGSTVATLPDVDVEALLCQLGVKYLGAVKRKSIPDIVVYVEGKTDKPVIEAIINHHRAHSQGQLPSTLVIPHKSGRFDATAVQALQRLASQVKPGARVVGIRDLDWFYGSLEQTREQVHKGPNWACFTLPCKEIENLLCEPELLVAVYQGEIELTRIEEIVSAESGEKSLVDEWKNNVTPRIRKVLPNSDDDSTKERKANAMCDEWAASYETRIRLVAGKELYKRIRIAIKKECGISRNSVHAIETVKDLPASLQAVRDIIFQRNDSGS